MRTPIRALIITVLPALAASIVGCRSGAPEKVDDHTVYYTGEMVKRSKGPGPNNGSAGKASAPTNRF